MTAKSINVSHEELGRYIRHVLVAVGAREKDAAVVADGLVWANLRGGDGHGVSRLPRYLHIIADGEISRDAVPKITHDRGATFVLDCGHGFGPVAVMQAAAMAVERAKKLGVCFCLVRETTHTGAIGRYAQWIAGQNFASLSTGPIAIAVPSGNGPIVLDMATSAIANGKILQSRNTGQALPEGTVLTEQGEATTDPNKAEILLPLGGPKGSGLGLMFEMLASVLAAAPIQARALGPEKRTRHTGNTAMIVIDIETFRALGDFKNDADTLTAILKTLPRQAGFDEITMPGERSQHTEAKRRKTGIPIPAKLWAELETIAKKHNVKMPAAVSPPA
jgi:ureidoglycolate dehydrogenase (NAD+)